MRLSRVLLVCTCVIIIILCTWGLNANAADPGIPGYLDPQTGGFRPLAPTDEEPAIVPPMTTGQIKVTIKATILSPAIPINYAVLCNSIASAIDFGSGHTFSESATVEATRTGSTVTCTVTIPYSWPLLTPSSDMIIIAYALSSPVTPASPGAGVLLNRLGSGTVATIKVPAKGTTTTESVTASF
jgi:hypothetical protein